MRDRHLAPHGQGADPVEDEAEREGPELALLVEMQVEAGLVAFGQAEDDVQVLDRIAIEAAGVDAAHQIRAAGERVGQQVGGAAVADDPGLREGDDLDRRPVLVRFARGEHAMEAVEAGFRVDLGVAAYGGGARGDGPAEGVGRPLADARLRGTPVGPVVLDQALKTRPRGVRAERQAEPGGVEVGVRVGEGGQRDPPAPVDDTRLVPRRPAAGRQHLRDPAVLDEEVAQLARPGAYVDDLLRTRHGSP